MEYLINPWNHQKEGDQRLSETDAYALLFEPGCGKTATLINGLRRIMNREKRNLRTLILCPPIVIRNWKDEFKMHSKVDPASIHLLTGPGSDRLKRFKKFAWGDFDGVTVAKPQIFVTNYESLLMEPLFEQFLAWGPEVFVLDESHLCKSIAAKRTKKAIQLADVSERRYLLSGTPVLNSPMDIFAQYRIMDRGASFGKNFFAFRGTYFYDKNAGMPKHKHFPDFRIRQGAMEEMNKKIYAKAMRAVKSECLDLPPFVEVKRFVQMTPEQVRLYNEMRRHLITFVNDKAVTASIVLTKALRLMQIASGYARTEGSEDISLGETPKLAALAEILEELTPNYKVIIWAVFKENYAAIRAVCEKLGIKYVEVHGDASGNPFEKVDAFNQDPEYRVFIGHPKSGGIGINLVGAAYSVVFSRDFSLGNRLQSRARNYRGGSHIHDKITEINLICEGTIEEEIEKGLANKTEMSEKILQDVIFEALNLTK